MQCPLDQRSAARATAEWIAIRTAPRQIGYARIRPLPHQFPELAFAKSLRARGEEALYTTLSTTARCAPPSPPRHR